MSRLVVALANVEFSWGFSIRTVGSSASSLQYLVPPPQTILGAFSWSIARLLSLPEVVSSPQGLVSTTKLLIDEGGVLWSAACLIGPATSSADMVRLIRAPYMREEYRVSVERQFGISAVGRIYAPNLRATFAYIIDFERFTTFINRYGYFGDPVELIKASLVSMVRIGSREGLIAVNNAEVAGASEVSSNPVETSFYIPEVCISEVPPGKARRLPVPAFDERHYIVRELIIVGREVWLIVPVADVWGDYVPVFDGRTRIRIMVNYDKCTAVSTGVDVIVFPRNGFKGLIYQ